MRVCGFERKALNEKQEKTNEKKNSLHRQNDKIKVRKPVHLNDFKTLDKRKKEGMQSKREQH